MSKLVRTIFFYTITSFNWILGGESRQSGFLSLDELQELYFQVRSKADKCNWLGPSNDVFMHDGAVIFKGGYVIFPKEKSVTMDTLFKNNVIYMFDSMRCFVIQLGTTIDSLQMYTLEEGSYKKNDDIGQFLTVTKGICVKINYIKGLDLSVLREFISNFSIEHQPPSSSNARPSFQESFEKCSPIEVRFGKACTFREIIYHYYPDDLFLRIDDKVSIQYPHGKTPFKIFGPDGNEKKCFHVPAEICVYFGLPRRYETNCALVFDQDGNYLFEMLRNMLNMFGVLKLIQKIALSNPSSVQNLELDIECYVCILAGIKYIGFWRKLSAVKLGAQPLITIAELENPVLYLPRGGKNSNYAIDYSDSSNIRGFRKSCNNHCKYNLHPDFVPSEDVSYLIRCLTNGQIDFTRIPNNPIQTDESSSILGFEEFGSHCEADTQKFLKGL